VCIEKMMMKSVSGEEREVLDERKLAGKRSQPSTKKKTQRAPRGVLCRKREREREREREIVIDNNRAILPFSCTVFKKNRGCLSANDRLKKRDVDPTLKHRYLTRSTDF
jgi:hypothetical protein